MDIALFQNPGLTVALALSLGMIAQSLAHHLRIPGIVLLLAAGVAFGPDGLGIIRPDSLGSALNILTGFAVSVILFEGGMNLKIRGLKRSQRSIRQLIVIGGICTVFGGAVATHYIMRWPWENALLFGTLVMVTGPTVINPLLKRLKVKRSVATVLEAEGVLIDAVGAVVATVALEAALSPAHGSPLLWVWHIVSRLGFGALIGSMTAVVMISFYRVRRLIPEGTENVFTLSIVLALFQCSNMILPESGIAAVTMAGIVIGNFSTHSLQELVEFKEELTVLMIGMLFVLLAADVRLNQVTQLGLPALGVVLVMMFIVRPVSVFSGTIFAELAWKQKILIAWIGPRGIVAAAVASLFAATLTEKGLPGGYELRAMVFLLIALTVVFAGMTGGMMASLLGLRRPNEVGWVFLGANSLSRALARLFKENGQEIVCIDSNADNCSAAEKDCTRVIYGNGLQSRYLVRAEIDTRKGALALTGNDEVNYLFIKKVKEEIKGISLYAALKTDTQSLTAKMLRQTGAELAFGAAVDVDLWNRRIKAKQVYLQIWKRKSDIGNDQVDGLFLTQYKGTGLINVAIRRNDKLMIMGDIQRFKKEDEIYLFIFEPELNAVNDLLTQAGFEIKATVDKDLFSTSACMIEPF